MGGQKDDDLHQEAEVVKMILQRQCNQQKNLKNMTEAEKKNLEAQKNLLLKKNEKNRKCLRMML